MIQDKSINIRHCIIKVSAAAVRNQGPLIVDVYKQPGTNGLLNSQLETANEGAQKVSHMEGSFVRMGPRLRSRHDTHTHPA